VRTTTLFGLKQGDRFVAKSDAQRLAQGPVSRVDRYGDAWAAVHFEDGRQYGEHRYVHGFEVVELVHRLADCEHGTHPVDCWDGCWTTL